MNFNQPPFLIKKIFNDLIWEIPNNENRIFLTFDDCDSEEATRFVLDVLKKNNIQATFFCCGKYVEKNQLHFNILENGHTIGNHGYEHINGFITKKSDYITNIEKCEKIFISNLFRPPYGKIRPSQIKVIKDKYKIVMWNLMTYDFKQENTTEIILENILTKIKSGSILVFHTNTKSENNLKKTLPKAIELLTNQNFKFDKIEF